MSWRIYECETCGEEHRYPISAALCCDAVQDAPDDEDNPDIILSSD